MPHIISHGARARESQSCTRIYSKRPNPTQSSSSSDQIINKSGGQPPYDTCVTPFGAKGVCPPALLESPERASLSGESRSQTRPRECGAPSAPGAPPERLLRGATERCEDPFNVTL